MHRNGTLLCSFIFFWNTKWTECFLIFCLHGKTVSVYLLVLSQMGAAWTFIVLNFPRKLKAGTNMWMYVKHSLLVHKNAKNNWNTLSKSLLQRFIKYICFLYLVELIKRNDTNTSLTFHNKPKTQKRVFLSKRQWKYKMCNSDFKILPSGDVFTNTSRAVLTLIKRVSQLLFSRCRLLEQLGPGAP